MYIMQNAKFKELDVRGLLNTSVHQPVSSLGDPSARVFEVFHGFRWGRGAARGGIRARNHARGETKAGAKIVSQSVLNSGCSFSRINQPSPTPIFAFLI